MQSAQLSDHRFAGGARRSRELLLTDRQHPLARLSGDLGAVPRHEVEQDARDPDAGRERPLIRAWTVALLYRAG